MGNRESNTVSQQSAMQMGQRKNQLQFKQVDFIRQIQGSIQEYYELLSPCLQQNQFYQLRKAIHLKTTLTRAVYIVNKYKIRSRQRQLFQQQINKLKKIDHPAAPKIYELYKSDHRFFVVLQYKQGESLAAILQKQHYFDQGQAASIMWQLLGLLSYCHKKDITHTDLKITSISFNSKRQQTIRVQDFSIARIFRIDEIIEQSINRVVLTAPELLTGQVGPKADIWSCGILLYILLCGQPPIMASSKVKLLHKYRTFYPRFKDRHFKNVSEQAKQLIRKMLRMNPLQRPSAQQIMQSPWFNNFQLLPPLPDNSLKRCLQQLYFFNPNSKLQQATWTFFVTALVSFDQKQLIMSIFMKLDRNCKGELDIDDLSYGICEIIKNQQKSYEIARKIMIRLRKTKICFSDFVTYCTNRFFIIRQTNLQKIFEIFDDDGSGEIEISQIRQTLGHSKQVGEDVWMQLMKQADANSDGKISYQQFSEMIRQLNYASNGSQKFVQDPFNQIE